MDFINIGKILKPQAIKGELKVQPLIESGVTFENLKIIYIENKSYEVEHFISRMGFLYLKLKGKDSIEQVECFRNKNIQIEKQNVDVSANEYFIDDIIGFEVIDEYNNHIGKLIEVEQFGGADVFVIFAYAREYRVPFVENIITKIDLDNKKIVVNKSEFDEVKICE